MATLEAALFTIVTSDATVNGLIATRMYRDALPHNATQPALVYQRIGGRPTTAHSGATGFGLPLYQFRIIAETTAEAEALADAVEAAINGYRGTTGARKIDGIQVTARRSQAERANEKARYIVEARIHDAGAT